jgi:hypothetical protein
MMTPLYRQLAYQIESKDLCPRRDYSELISRARLGYSLITEVGNGGIYSIAQN